MTGANDNGETVAGGGCPICGKPTNPAARPFCSKRCADVDLQRWLSGRYVIPVADEPEEPSDDEERER